MKVSSQPYHGTLLNARNRVGMQVIDREREKEWLEQMDTILIFVWFIFFDFRRN